MNQLTQYSTRMLGIIRSRLRTADPSLPVYASDNEPGGPGHAWVKNVHRPFVYGKSFWATDITTGDTLVYPERPAKLRSLYSRRFIPASLVVAYLYEQGDYEAMLLSLRGSTQALLEGSWDIAEGAAFSEFDRTVHAPFEIPNTWRKFRACDHGYSSATGVLWFAVDPTDETLLIYRQLRQQSPCQGTGTYGATAGAGRGDSLRGARLFLWHKRGDTGPSLAEQMIVEGCRWRPSDEAVVAVLR